MPRSALTLSLLALLLAVPALAADPVGWRNDGTSRFPNADPPTEWSADKNVIWKCALPKWSNASPVIVGERIFVCSEPTDLICVDKNKGQILWTRSNNYDLVMTPEEQAQDAKDKAEAARIKKEDLAPLQKKQGAISAELRQAQPPATRPAVPPTEEQKAAMVEIRGRQDDVNKQIKAVQARIDALEKWALPSTEGSNGHSSATPVSDGKVVCAIFNNGLVACYDLEGNRKWVRFVEKPKHPYGSGSSPVIYQDKLLVQISNMVALDLATGKDVWTAAGTQWHWGTPGIMRVGKIDVAITAHGDVIRLADGKVLAKKLCPLEYNSPLVVGDVAYFIDGTGKAIKLSPKGEDDIETKVLWSPALKHDGKRYYATPLLEGGLLYAINEGKHFSLIDIADGKVVAEQDLDVGKQTVYASAALAGKYIFLSNEDGTSVVLEPGKEMKLVARNTLERYRCTPVFEGERMYIRGYKFLYCIGVR